MESISKTGHKFTGKFAATAVRLGLAKPSEEDLVNEELPDTEANELENFPVPMEDLIAESNSETDGVMEEPVKEVKSKPVLKAKVTPVKKAVTKKATAPKVKASKKAKK
jgi:hypothetical protein